MDRIVANARDRGTALDDALVRDGVLSEESVAICRALDLGVPFVDPREYDIELANSSLLPEVLVRTQKLFPLFSIDGMITLGMKDPGDLAVIDQVRLRAGCQVDPCMCPPSALDALIDRAFNIIDDNALVPLAIPVAEESAEPAKPSSKVVRIVAKIVEEAAREGASDVHIEPERDRMRVRIRVDGILHEKSVLPRSLHAPIVSRLKIEANLDIAETRKPQDGHFCTRIPQGELDIRISTVPTVFGENVVLRMLPSTGNTVELDKLGMPEATLERFVECLMHPHGMILVTGPTGSGKTTTLYAALERLNTIDRHVMTIEDPVERRVALLSQIEVNPKAGLSFAAGLRSILRQDPDVIMMGEIRDGETADIAIQAALTGHMVLSTLHTNTAAGAVQRLTEMGIPPFLITSSLNIVIAQRLVRRVCTDCKGEVDPDRGLVMGLGLESIDDVTFVAGSGCARCLHTGFKGRIGVYEMLELSEELGCLLVENASRGAVQEELKRCLLGDLKEDGLRKVLEGQTTLEEVARIVGVRSGRHPESELVPSS